MTSSPYTPFEPTLSDTSFKISNQPNYIDVGSYICFTEDSVRKYGRVLNCIPSADALQLKLNVFVQVEELDLGMTLIQNRNASDMNELVQSTVVQEIRSNLVEHIIFVFHFNDIVSGKYICEDIEFSYVSDSNKQVSTISAIFQQTIVFHFYVSSRQDLIATCKEFGSIQDLYVIM